VAPDRGGTCAEQLAGARSGAAVDVARSWVDDNRAYVLTQLWTGANVPFTLTAEDAG
jgi:hypothetical protein